MKLEGRPASGAKVDVAIGSSGLLAIGALVSLILLSTEVVVHVAARRREPQDGAALHN